VFFREFLKSHKFIILPIFDQPEILPFLRCSVANSQNAMIQLIRTALGFIVNTYVCRYVNCKLFVVNCQVLKSQQDNIQVTHPFRTAGSSCDRHQWRPKWGPEKRWQFSAQFHCPNRCPQNRYRRRRLWLFWSGTCRPEIGGILLSIPNHNNLHTYLLCFIAMYLYNDFKGKFNFLSLAFFSR